MKLFNKIKTCRISDDKNLVTVFNFGRLFLTGIFPKKKEKLKDKTPVEVVFSNKSKLLQLKHNYNEKKLFGDNYGYRSGLNLSMIYHLKKKSNFLKKFIKGNYNNKKNLFILDIGSNDGTFLNFFSKKFNRIGLDPSANKFKEYYQKDVKIISKILNENTFSKKFNKKFSLITAIAMFYDLKDPKNFLKTLSRLLNDNGLLHIEIAYLPDIINNNIFDTFCQEHLTYYSLHSFKYLLDQTDLSIQDFGTNSINGGSMWFNIIKKNNVNFFTLTNKTRLKICNQFEYEKRIGIDKIRTYFSFFNRIKKNIIKIRNELKKIRKGKKIIYGYGASTKGNVLLQMTNISNKIFHCILDVNKEKFNTYTPGTNILIRDENYLKLKKPHYIFVLIWHFQKTVSKKLNNFLRSGGKIIIPFPCYRVIKKS
jgi:hypothetical protein